MKKKATRIITGKYISSFDFEEGVYDVSILATKSGWTEYNKVFTVDVSSSGQDTGTVIDVSESEGTAEAVPITWTYVIIAAIVLLVASFILLRKR